MQTFYQFVITYRGKLEDDDESLLAEWIFQDHLFPKYSTSYNEISHYLEMNSPFIHALAVFDTLWDVYNDQVKGNI
ncbi:MAG TPA: YozE family protein [Cerasibacillus sp.]|uniref:YozE family protein n=1 Tax=Cerasibacillus sp. TaxID=2498711 RepID=UPI002F3F6101